MEKLIIGIVFVGVGLLFFFNNKNISKGAFKFYQQLYAEDNLKVMFRACGVVFVLGGFILIFVK